MVVKGLNDDELPALARLTLEKPWHVRFIELMPVGNAQDWGEGFPLLPDRYISVQDMHARLSVFNLEPASVPVGNGPARTFRIPGAPGTVGFISPLGEHFCQNCNRLRLTADGYLRPCLLQDNEINVREALRSGEPLIPLFQNAVDAKPKGHELFLQNYPEIPPHGADWWIKINRAVFIIELRARTAQFIFDCTERFGRIRYIQVLDQQNRPLGQVKRIRSDTHQTIRIPRMNRCIRGLLLIQTRWAISACCAPRPWRAI